MTAGIEDTQDFSDAERGFIAPPPSASIMTTEGHTAWDAGSFSFLENGECPDTVNPHLWRQGKLCAKAGLFQVTDRVYQVRNLDISNLTFIEGTEGVIVVDPLLSVETAAAGIRLYREHRGDRPVTGMIYTHSHSDHYGGAFGILPDGRGDVPVLAPAKFTEHAVSENVHVGPAMARRSDYMFGNCLERSPRGLVSSGIGTTLSEGSASLVLPSLDVTHTGQQETIDGVPFIFQLAPDTEAPAEMHFLLPGYRALCMAENATRTMHNVLTPRGALVRDAHAWSRSLGEALTRFAPSADVLFASHLWPTWGAANITEFLSRERDLYAFMHDQTVRLMNKGLTGIEIAEVLQLPPELEKSRLRGYYGTLSHNVKAIYQRYMGWYDGNPAHLWEHPPTETARRYVEDYGGLRAIIARAQDYSEKGDLRFAATLLNHAVFADPDNVDAREVLSGVYEKLGYGAESGPWRNIFLTGAKELREGRQPPVVRRAVKFAPALTTEQLLDILSVRIDGPRSWQHDLTVDVMVRDRQGTWRLTLANGALTHHQLSPDEFSSNSTAAVTLTLTATELWQMATTHAIPDGATVDGDRAVLTTLLALLDPPDFNFAIVTP
ncbi:alkyl sulfatase dimerization domain-containing protein [Streptomyces sp. SCSIO 30461]|uniref:alkyl/aryl-sulfatase n=1 Tax=Streptomyces sp. SCSIO 30461 TaxID=3118085 RepID=UPI0030CA7C0E